MDAAFLTRKQNAIILGGSLTGLLAARVLSQYYTQVIIIEKDIAPREPQARKGQPQTKHPNGLLPCG